MTLLRFPTTRLFTSEISNDEIYNLVASLCVGTTTVIVDERLAHNERIKKLLTLSTKNEIIFVNDIPNELDLNKKANNLKFHFESLLAIGGGSTLDSAKYLKRFQMQNLGKNSRLILIPTIPGSGAEVSKNIVYSDKFNVKKAYRSELYSADIAISDIEILASCPDQLLLLGAFDAYHHIFEAFTLKFERRKSMDYQLFHGLSLIRQALELLRSNRELAISKFSEASIIGGDTISNFRSGLIHTLGESYNSFWPKIPHPVTLTVFYDLVRRHLLLHKNNFEGRLVEELEYFSWEMWFGYFSDFGLLSSINEAKQLFKLVDLEEFINLVSKDKVIFKEIVTGLNVDELETILMELR